MKTLIATMLVTLLASSFAFAKSGENSKSCNGNNSGVGLHDKTTPDAKDNQAPVRSKKGGGKQTS